MSEPIHGGVIVGSQDGHVGPTALTTEGAWNARWSPDGTEVAFLRADGIRVMRADGSQERRILEAAGIRGLDC